MSMTGTRCNSSNGLAQVRFSADVSPGATLPPNDFVIVSSFLMNSGTGYDDALFKNDDGSFVPCLDT